MVFLVESGDVLDVGGVEVLLHLLFDGRGEGDGTEDCEGVVGEFDDGPAAADFDAALAEEGRAAGQDVGGEEADYHHLLGVLGWGVSGVVALVRGSHGCIPRG